MIELRGESPAGRRAGRVGARLDEPREPSRSLLPRPHYDPESFGRLSERIARFLGTARFLVYMTVFIAVWLAWNSLGPAELRFDPYPFIFLTLMLSVQASFAAPLILLAQNRQDYRDRVQYEQDRTRNERSIADTEYLTREIAGLRLAVSEVATRDFLRSELERVLRELNGEHGGAPAPRRQNGEAAPKR
ncbi:DUF1003 domain-containing protein [Actinomadura keratinilytica]|jgi:uncharacterized membrane protein|uniref:DUF1003 domain-containing protein n=1 Tax=Actinomadura keratinilytica TaxID=547461 RepID=A0ABP7YBY4_9ACTN